MSWRVRWVRWTHRAGRPAIGDTIGLRDEHRLYTCRGYGAWLACDARAFMAGASDDVDVKRFRRRSDAKRWLIARAAGLAEVPRRKSFGTRYGSPQTGVVVTCPSGGMYVPRGWRFAGGYMNVDGEMVVHLVRNRRRR